MKALLSKEFKLCVHPALFIYLGLILMLLIPNYPYLVSCFFVCNGIFFCFQQARENSDAMYTAMLPVSKAQAVKARVWFVVIIEMIDIVLMAGMCAFALIAMPETNAGGTDHSLSLIAFALVLYAIFNIIYLPSFYKTGYKAGTAFLKSAIGIAIWIVLSDVLMIVSNAILESGLDVAFFRFIHENIDCMPKTAQAWGLQAILFGAGLILYIVCTLLATKISIKRYEKVSVQ